MIPLLHEPLLHSQQSDIAFLSYLPVCAGVYLLQPCTSYSCVQEYIRPMMVSPEVAPTAMMEGGRKAGPGHFETSFGQQTPEKEIWKRL